MPGPCLNHGKTPFANVPPQEGDLKPKTRRGQLSWDFSGSEHPLLHLRLLLSRTVCSQRLSPSFLLSSSAKLRETNCRAGLCEGWG